MPRRLVSTNARAWMTAITAALLMLGSFGLAAYSFSVAHRSGCASRDASLTVLRDVLVLSQPAPDELAHMSPRRRRRVARFYQVATDRINKARC